MISGISIANKKASFGHFFEHLVSICQFLPTYAEAYTNISTITIICREKVDAGYRCSKLLRLVN